MAKKKAKWLEVITPELLKVAIDTLKGEEVGEKEITKVTKIVEELIERTPSEDGVISVEDALSQAQAAISTIGEAYNAEIEAITAGADDIEEDDEDEEEEAPKKSKKSKKNKDSKESKKSKKSKKAAKVEEDDEDDEEEDEDPDYDSMSLKKLRTIAKEMGFKVSKKATKEDLIDAITSEDDDEE